MYFRTIFNDTFLATLVDNITKLLKLNHDNKPTIFYSYDNKSSAPTECIDINYYIVKERVLYQIINLEHINTEQKLADPLTKWLPPSMSRKHVANIDLMKHL